MKALTEDKVVYHGELDQFTKFHNDNHESRIDSVVNLKQGKPTFWSLMLTKNSPLTPFFKKIAIESFQFGLRDALRREWIGPDIKSISSVKKNTLTGGQTFLLFVVLLIFMLLSTITFVIEVMISRIWIKSSMYPQEALKALKMPIPIAWEGSQNPMKLFQVESGEILQQPKRQRQRNVPTQTKSSKISIKSSMSPKKTSKIPIPIAWEDFPNPRKLFQVQSGEILQQTKRKLGVDVSTQTESSRSPKYRSFHVI